jgi:hypothetical protein
VTRDKIESWRADDGVDRHRAQDRLPRLAMDSAGRPVLWDHPVKMSGLVSLPDQADNARKAKMPHIMTNQELQSYTKKLVARLLGQDAAVDDETVEKLKGFLKSRLSAEDHETLCSMLDGAGDGGAEDNEPARVPYLGTDDEKRRQQAADSFSAMYPDAAKIRIDNSGLPLPPRPAKYSAEAAASFETMFPDAKRIKVLG